MARESSDDVYDAEPDPSGPGAESEESGESVRLAVRGGEIVADVASGTPEEGVVGGATLIRGTLRLENERVMTFEIDRSAGRGSCADESTHLHHAPGEAVATAPVAARSGLTARDIMTSDVLIASPDELVEDVAKQLAFHNISGMPVEDGAGQVVGIVSEIDVVGRIGTIVGDVMTSEVISITTQTTLQQIAALMAERRVRRVPVMADGTLVGIVSRADLVRALAGHV